MLASNAISRRRTRISVPQCRIPGPRTCRALTIGSRTSRRQDARFPHQTRTRKSTHVSSPLSCPSGTARNTPAPPLPAGEAP
jgi:hypothetical protein